MPSSPLAPARRDCSRRFSTVDSGPAAPGRDCARPGVPSLAPRASCPTAQLPRGASHLCARSTGSHMHVSPSFPLLSGILAGLCSPYLVPGHSCPADVHHALALHRVSCQRSSASQQQINWVASGTGSLNMWCWKRPVRSPVAIDSVPLPSSHSPSLPGDVARRGKNCWLHPRAGS